jgi:hypothetical protein
VSNWNDAVEALRERFPGTKDSILFCIHKLEQDASLGLKEMREEATEAGISLAGRSLHSAKVLLGMGEPVTRKPRAAKDEDESADEAPAAADSGEEAPKKRRGRPKGSGKKAPVARERASSSGNSSFHSIENQMLGAIRQIHDAAAKQNAALVAAVEEAIAVLQAALKQ